jgi:hypothetical protein
MYVAPPIFISIAAADYTRDILTYPVGVSNKLSLECSKRQSSVEEQQHELHGP